MLRPVQIVIVGETGYLDDSLVRLTITDEAGHELAAVMPRKLWELASSREERIWYRLGGLEESFGLCQCARQLAAEPEEEGEPDNE